MDIPNVELASGQLKAMPEASVMPSAYVYAFSPISGAIAKIIGSTIKIAVELDMNSLTTCTNKTKMQKMTNGEREAPTRVLNAPAIYSVPPAVSSALASPKHPPNRPTMFQLMDITAFFWEMHPVIMHNSAATVLVIANGIHSVM